MADDNEIQIDPDKYIKQIEHQRNNALTQAAQCIVLVEQMNEQLSEAAEQLAEAHRKIAELEGGKPSDKAPESGKGA